MSAERRRRALLAVALLPALAGACAEERSGLRIKLVTDPTLNSEAQLLALADRLELVVDVAGGFADTHALADEALRLADDDGDDELELVFSHAVAGRPAFPLLRLRRDPTVDVVAIRARALRGKEIVAIGASIPARLAGVDDTAQVSVPLDLRSRYRPPRVVSSFPAPGQEALPAAFGSVVVSFSKWLPAASVNAGLRLLREAGGSEPVDVSWELTHSVVIDKGLPEVRTMARVVLGCPLAGGRYRVEADKRVVDLSGAGLDQDLLDEDDDPYQASFSVLGPPADPATGCGQPCSTSADCNPLSEREYFCVGSGPQSGTCVPSPATCDDHVCPAPYSCVEQGGQAFCSICGGGTA